MKKKKYIFWLFLAALLLSGCTVHTVDKMYCLPKRSAEYADVQSAINNAMVGLEYCAPRSGENQQTVQMADLDGDGSAEYLVFAKANGERPLRILVFDEVEEEYQLIGTVESNGSAFDMVEYVQMDTVPGVEMVVGCQLSDQMLRSVSTYTFTDGELERLMKTNYAKVLAVDLDMDSIMELFVLRPGQTETDNGVAELYGVENGIVVRSNEASMSGPVDQLKRILIGQLSSGQYGVYAASAVGEAALITDVFAYLNDTLVNVSFSKDSGTSVQTMRNYYVYADDIDHDGVVELPALIHMQPLTDGANAEQHNLIRWYAMTADGEEVEKMYTYHDFVGGWYLELDETWASRLTVQQNGNEHAFYLWSETYEEPQKIMTLYAMSGEKREGKATDSGRFTLLKTDSITYAASLEPAAKLYRIDQDTAIRMFHLIRQDWKTGEM